MIWTAVYDAELF